MPRQRAHMLAHGDAATADLPAPAAVVPAFSHRWQYHMPQPPCRQHNIAAQTPPPSMPFTAEQAETPEELSTKQVFTAC